MKSTLRALPLLLFVLSAPVFAKDGVQAGHYIEPGAVDFKTLAGEPPTDGSVQTKSEIEVMLQKQQLRTAEDEDRAQKEEHLSVFLFANVLGPWFEEKNLPLTTALFARAGGDLGGVTNTAKSYWHRPRPWLQDSRIHPAVTKPNNDSYPSGHAAAGEFYALILAELAPDLKDRLLARGEQIGDDRILAGVHFPSDVRAGRVIAREVVKRLLASPAFQSDLSQARAEFVKARH